MIFTESRVLSGTNDFEGEDRDKREEGGDGEEDGEAAGDDGVQLCWRGRSGGIGVADNTIGLKESWRKEGMPDMPQRQSIHVRCWGRR